MTTLKYNSDAELIERAKQDPEYFGQLMERYEKPLFHYIRRMSQLPQEEIEDLLQEVFIKIYQKLNEYPEIIKFSSWAYRITHNHLIDYFRKTHARPRTNAMEDQEWLRIISDKANLEKEIMDKDCVDKITSCINELPIHYKEVLVLRYLEQKDYEEIMDILKKPKGSVATLINRGRALLRQSLKEKNIDCF
jgi:RNA polymerase sigma-70 factor (ECF subfamily)